MLLFALLPGTVWADALMKTDAMLAPTIAEIYVDESGVRMTLEIGLVDIELFANLLPDEVFAEAGPGQAATARPTITVKHLRRIAKELGEDVRDEELMEMIEEFDQNGDGVIDEKEFRAIMTQGADAGEE